VQARCSGQKEWSSLHDDSTWLIAYHDAAQAASSWRPCREETGSVAFVLLILFPVLLRGSPEREGDHDPRAGFTVRALALKGIRRVPEQAADVLNSEKDVKNRNRSIQLLRFFRLAFVRSWPLDARATPSQFPDLPESKRFAPFWLST